MFENAGIGEGRKITYEQLVGSLDKDGGLRSLLADGFSSTERVAQDTHVYPTVTAAYPSMVANFASPLAPESELYRLRSVLKPDVKRKPVRRNKPQGPALGALLRGLRSRSSSTAPSSIAESALSKRPAWQRASQNAPVPVGLWTSGCCGRQDGN